MHLAVFTEGKGTQPLNLFLKNFTSNKNPNNQQINAAITPSPTSISQHQKKHVIQLKTQ